MLSRGISILASETASGTAKKSKRYMACITFTHKRNPRCASIVSYYLHATDHDIRAQDDIEHQKKADHIVNTVLGTIDKDKDGKITQDEFVSVGLDGLPNFDNLGAEGHHYDVESGQSCLPIPFSVPD